jgi:hypothetical protein
MSLISRIVVPSRMVRIRGPVPKEAFSTSTRAKGANVRQMMAKSWVAAAPAAKTARARAAAGLTVSGR